MIDTSPAHSPLCDARNGLPIILKSLLREGLLLLWRGFEYSRDLRVEAWNFAVERDILYQVGLSTIDLQWLIARRYVEFGQRRAGSGEHAQWLPQPPEPYQQKGICFFLTQAGADFALQTLREVLRPLPGTPVEPPGGWLTSGRTEMEANGKKPSWNREHRELRWGDCLIKQFKWPASNQKAILMAFEEECWPRRIDDPLPPHPEQDPKRRLHDTIKCLNRNHKARVIRFSGDGTGEGVYWAYLDGSAAAF